MSIMGHDRGEIYLVLESNENFVYLADGRLKTLDKPKKKNIKHINRLGKCDEFIDIKMRGDSFDDVKVKYLLKRWRNRCLSQTL